MGLAININLGRAANAGEIVVKQKKEYVCAYEDPANEKRGSKYDETKDLDIKQIAQLVRKDIKLAMKNGELAGVVKVSVKIDRFSMGQALDIKVTEFSGQFYNPDYIRATQNFSDYHNDEVHEVNRSAGRHSSAAKSALKQLEDIGNAYNRDNSDSMSDYSDINFFLRVGFDYSVIDKAESIEKVLISQ